MSTRAETQSESSVLAALDFEPSCAASSMPPDCPKVARWIAAIVCTGCSWRPVLPICHDHMRELVGDQARHRLCHRLIVGIRIVSASLESADGPWSRR